jgi:hypothetical protein
MIKQHLVVTCTIGVEDSHLETDACSVSSGTDLISYQEVGE